MRPVHIPNKESITKNGALLKPAGRFPFPSCEHHTTARSSGDLAITTPNDRRRSGAVVDVDADDGDMVALLLFGEAAVFSSFMAATAATVAGVNMDTRPTDASVFLRAASRRATSLSDVGEEVIAEAVDKC